MDERYKDENLKEHLDEMEELLEESQKSTLKEDAEEALDSAGEMVDDGLKAISDKTGNLFSGIKDMATDAVASVGDVGTKLTEGASDLVEGAADTLSDTVTDAVESVSDTGSDIVSDVKDAGADIVESGSGMISGAAMVVGAAATGLIGGAKKIGNATTTGVKAGAASIETGVAQGKKSVNDAFTSPIQTDAPAVLRPKDIFDKKSDIPEPKVEKGKQEITRILSTLKESKFSQDYGILMYLIAFPVILLVVWQFIQNGFSIRIALVVLLGIFFSIYRGAVKGITREVFELKSKAQSGDTNPINDILAKASYVLSGIELNLKRISYTKWLYTLFTPFLLYGVAELWKGPFDTKTSFWLFLVGFVLSFVVWPFAFRSDVKKLESLEMDLVDIRSTFL